ncbi:glycoside hydrolase family 16 protein [Christiangramia sabulilitoris]|uniref:Glycoside hydrolase family 16 protein n=1 Tax=Christiangramia sabulilitoris TaxID=2583991 RepID=A0A550I5S0_9FLAO|nr:glycoside hydrolase family 16 protein [Christiangramia sabulilitoris]TRO66309.1 glycoside hydrolase family 16 protein [Christiangramia sabulilitoris]
MNFSFFNITLIFLLFSNLDMAAQNDVLIWSDEFENSGKPDPEKWNFEIGYIRNQEEQIYTVRRKNVKVRDGKLEIVARKENYRNKKYNPAIKNYRYNTPASSYTSGSIHTKDKFEFKYGRVEVRAKLPSGNGVWPAIWMLGANFDDVEYPLAGEIDIMEHVGISPEEIHATVHFPSDNSSGIQSDGGKISVENVSKDYHVYAVNWDREKIEFSVDNFIYHSFNLEQAGTENNPFRKPFYLILNLALGGNWPGPVNPDILPQKFLIDYVRVYKTKEE